MTFGIFSYLFTVLVFAGGAVLIEWVLALLVSIAVASATLIWSDYEEDRRPLIKTTVDQIMDKFREWFKMQSK